MDMCACSVRMSNHSSCKPLQTLCVTLQGSLWGGCSPCAPELPGSAPIPSGDALGPALGDRHELKPHCLMCDELIARLWAAKAWVVWVTDPKRVWLGAPDRAVTDRIVTVILGHPIRLVSAPRCGLIHPALISAGQKLPPWVSCVNQRRDTSGDASGSLHYGIICPHHW